MKATRRVIEVVADWTRGAPPVLVGTLTATPSRGKEVFAFEYDPRWLSQADRVALDPGLVLYGGPQYPNDERNFGVFLDSSPDRWGRVLMQRREALRARTEERRPRTLLESDYLLGVFDGHRMGGLRFRLDATGPFLDDDGALATPPWTSLRELEHASLQLERAGIEDDPRYGRWLQMLLATAPSVATSPPR